jgi:alanine racemase
MNYTIESIADFCNGKASIIYPGSKVGRILIDHRIQKRDDALFAAIKGSRFDGHDFIPELIDHRVHHFLVSDPDLAKRWEGKANFIVVDDVVKALQSIAREHRDNYSLPVIAITGSNGKTIVKEWLNTVLEWSFQICRSPKSYNSQIGVPLSVFELGSNDSIAIFETGISQPGEMQRLEQIVRPTMGIFTNLGDAHAAHFVSEQQKFQEKWKLFERAQHVIACKDQAWVQWLSATDKSKCVFWSLQDPNAQVFYRKDQQEGHFTWFFAKMGHDEYRVQLPFTDRVSIENALHCFTMAWHLGALTQEVIDRFQHLTPIAMRMEVKQGIEESLIIDDTYNADLHSLRASVDQLMTHADRDKWVIISDLRETQSFARTYETIADMLKEAEVTHMVAIGPEITAHRHVFEPIKVQCFESVDAFWEQLNTKQLRNKAILIKGARKFRLEKLVNRLQAKQRITTLEVNLQQLGENLRYFRKNLAPKTKVMVMVKAFAYGSGSFEVAHYFQTQCTVDYLVVAYVDEGVLLRQKGVSLPIMVMSPGKTSYETMIQYGLEPEIYSITSLLDFIRAARSMRHFFEEYPIHLKIDSGMHRLGFEEADLNKALAAIKEARFVKVKSVFTHLSASDESEHDDFTRDQIRRFETLYAELVKGLGCAPDRHVLNSTGVLRFPEYHFEMVRLGIGLYGFSGNEDTRFLHAIGALKSYIVQVRTVRAGESVGYARKGASDVERRIATVAIGYADGLDRRLGNGIWNIRWQGVYCPIVGNVCMDMIMIDVSNTAAQEGDEVVVFEGAHEILDMANKLNTIPYEILTKIPERVRRVYLHE